MSDITEQVAEFLHERFALDFEEHWRDLDQFGRLHSRAWEMAVALTREAPFQITSEPTR